MRNAHPYRERGAARGQGLKEASMEALSAVSRRDFLRTGGAVVVSFTLNAALPKWAVAQGLDAGAEVGKPVDPREVDSFLAFHFDGSVTLYTSKRDVGTRPRTGRMQRAAEELGLPVEGLTILEGETALTPNQGGTGGSSGIPVGGVGVRQAAATARQAILNLAAEQLKRPAAELTFADGVVRPSAGGQGIGIGMLIGGKRLALE